MRDGNVPRFFVRWKGGWRAQLVWQLAGQLVEPANPANSSFSGKEEREEGRKREGRMGEREGMGGEERGGKLFVKQIKTNKKKDKCFRTCQTNCSLSSNFNHSSPQKYQIPAEKPSSGEPSLSWKILLIFSTFFF